MPFNATDIAKTAKEVVRGFLSNWPHGVDIHAERIPRFSLRMSFQDELGSVCSFTLTEQLNCCGILVSTNTHVRKDKQGQGLGTELQNVKMELAKAFGYSVLMATVNMTGNPGQVHLLEKCGWKLVDSFTNGRTKNKVGIYTKQLS